MPNRPPVQILAKTEIIESTSSGAAAHMKHTSSSRPENPTTDRLYDSAADLFWRHGYAATTTREIPTAFGIQQASLYHHIANKEDLLYRICVSSLEPFVKDVPAA